MNNADKPAMAQEYALWCESLGNCPTLGAGLTKREYLATMAMQGLLSATEPDGAWSHTADIAASTAVEYADALLKELEK